MLINIIIGKNSNLSKKLSLQIDNCLLISSRELLDNLNSLEKFKDKEINLIFNNFQPATTLNTLNSAEQYVNNSILVAALFFSKIKYYRRLLIRTIKI